MSTYKISACHMVGLAIASMLGALLLITGCDVHEYPVSVDEYDSTDTATVVLNLKYEHYMPLYKDTAYTRTADGGVQAVADSEFGVRYIVEVYRQLRSGSFSADLVLRKVISREMVDTLHHSIPLALPAGNYSFMAWTDYVDAGSTEDKYYKVGSLTEEVMLDGEVEYEGCNDMYDVFKGKETGMLQVGDNDTLTVQMTRPVGKYMFIATDFRDFMKKNPTKPLKGEPTRDDVMQAINDQVYKVKVCYIGFMPTAYHVANEVCTDAVMGKEYASVILPFNGLTREVGDEVIVCFDYVFVNPWEGAVQLMIVIYDDNDRELARTQTMTVPLKQGHLTIMRGDFLTQEKSGVGISPEFVGPDYNIRL